MQTPELKLEVKNIETQQTEYAICRNCSTAIHITSDNFVRIIVNLTKPTNILDILNDNVHCCTKPSFQWVMPTKEIFVIGGK